MVLWEDYQPLSNEILYKNSMREIIEIYLRDFDEKTTFMPLFFLNDLLRFWRTLCLNYESARQETDKPSRKKNLNLKYSRMVTVFSTVLYVLTEKNLTEENLIEMCAFSPLERFARALDKLADPSFEDEFNKALDIYEDFLAAKESGQIESDDLLKQKLDSNAEKLSDFVYNVLMSEGIERKYKKHLVI